MSEEESEYAEQEEGEVRGSHRNRHVRLEGYTVVRCQVLTVGAVRVYQITMEVGQSTVGVCHSTVGAVRVCHSPVVVCQSAVVMCHSAVGAVRVCQVLWGCAKALWGCVQRCGGCGGCAEVLWGRAPST